MNIVEVKYVAKPPPKALLYKVLHRAQSYVLGNNLKSVNLILAVVVDRNSDVEATQKRLMALSDEASIPTVVRVYALSELQAKFGVVDAS